MTFASRMAHNAHTAGTARALSNCTFTFHVSLRARPSRCCPTASRTRPSRHNSPLQYTAFTYATQRGARQFLTLHVPFAISTVHRGFRLECARERAALTFPTFLLTSLCRGCDQRPMADDASHHHPASSQPRTASVCGAATSPTTRSTATRTRTGRAARPRSPARTTSPPLASPARSEGLRPAAAACTACYRPGPGPGSLAYVDACVPRW